MQDYIERIGINPDICNGKPIIRGMRITVKTVIEYLAAGETIENILKAYPSLQKEDVIACLQFAAKLSDSNIANINLMKAS